MKTDGNNSIWIKFTSGRFWLTMAGALCLVLLTGTVCWCLVKGIKGQEISIVLGGVIGTLGSIFTSYFGKERNINWRLDQGAQEKENQNETDTTRV